MKKVLQFIFLFFLLFSSVVEANLNKKSAIFYFGKEISYSTVGIHDYIFVEPNNTNVYTHGFSVYQQKIYAHIKLNKSETKLLKTIKKLSKKGFKNIYLEEIKSSDINLEKLLVNLHTKYPDMKIALHTVKSSLNTLYRYIDIIVVKSLMNKDVTNYLSYGLDLIDIEFTTLKDKDEVVQIKNQITEKSMIPYITDSYKHYGYSTKDAIKREVLTLIDESGEADRMTISAHQYGALPLEYLGYIQKLYDVSKGLPKIDSMDHYAGVVIWLNKEYSDPVELMIFVKELSKRGIKVAFVNNFGTRVDGFLLKQLGIDILDSDPSLKNKKKIIQRDEMIGYEAEPILSASDLYFVPEDSKSLYTYKDTHNMRSTPAAITPWGGYVMSEALMVEFNDKNIWVINPFLFFKEALRLKPLLVPDTTTENGNRLLFTHIDGDGIMNAVESNPKLYSGDILLEKILKKYKIPHSVSVIGAEIDPDGLYPKLSKRLTSIVKKMYALPNVEAATHTFTHPFYWGKIKDGFLPLEYRLKVKNYHFSYDREIKQCLDDINNKDLPKNKAKANTIFWSGDCSPREDSLDYIYKHKILNINGGYTTISNANPWLGEVAPLGLERGEYYQIFTGAQNENVYTNDWLGPFWGFKKVVQTFKLTNSPKRLKPIDVYYHIYSGSKTASLNALKYIFNWALRQDVMPIYTSAYIPKAMDYFTVSLANEGDRWLVDGMKDLKTLRIEKKDAGINLKRSKTTLGINHFENHTYIALDNQQKHFIDVPKKISNKNDSYLLRANAKVVEFHKGISSQQIKFDGEVDLVLHFHLSKGCKLNSLPKPSSTKQKDDEVILKYKNQHKATVTLQCTN